MTDYKPLTEAQKRIWFIEQIYSGTPINNIGGVVRIEGDISFDRLQKALWTFIEAHQGMRIQLTNLRDIPHQYVIKCKLKKCRLFDFSIYQEPKHIFNQWLAEEAAKPFQLYDSPLFYFAFFRLSRSSCGYFIKLHHMLADMWTISLLTEQIKLLYENTEYQPTGSNYLDYLAVEQKYFHSIRYEKDREYWLQGLSFISPTENKKEPPNPKSQRLTLSISAEETKKITEFILKEQSSLNVFFNAVVAAYFYLKKGLIKQIIGLPVFNRLGAVEKHTVGMFVDTLPIFLDIDPSLTLATFCRYMKRKLMQSYVHHRFPYNSLVQELNKKGIDINSHMAVSVNFYHQNHPLTFSGCPVKNEEFFSGYQIYPLHIIVNQWQEGSIQLHIQYQTERYETDEILTMSNDFFSLIKNIITDPTDVLQQVTLQSKDQRQYQRMPYRSPEPLSHLKNTTVINLFERQVLISPSKIAVQDGMRLMSYKELKNNIDKLATFLKDFTRSDAIAIMGEPSIECLIAILSIQKLGFYYIPIHSQESLQQVKFILSDAHVDTLLVWSKVNLPISQIDCRTMDIREILKANTILDRSIENKSSPDKLAYAIYTSGSTGKPKGVKISHNNLMAYLNWAKVYVNHENSVFAFYSSIAFDLTITSIFLPLIRGDKIKIFRSDERYVLLPIINDQEVTVLKATPSHLNTIKDETIKKSCLKTLIVGGENLEVELTKTIQDAFGEALSIYNEYGPTEATVGCMIYRFDQNIDCEGSVPVGSAAGTVKLKILNETNEPVDIGDIGELYIGGDQVAQGYLNRPELTARCFLTFPNEQTVFYKTGDLVRQNNRGNLVFHGRIDEQVKINGYRIELGEIQTCLLEYTGITHACVIPLHMQNSTILGGFFIANKKINTELLQAFLVDRLHSYKIPSFFKQVEEIPLTANGKVNRTRLRQLFDESLIDQQSTLSDNFVANSVVEAAKTALKTESIDLQANYFHLGGDSISAIQISSKLASQGIELPVKNILSSKTIEALCTAARNKTFHKQPTGISKGNQPFNAILHWFFEQNFKFPHFYHNSVLVQLKAPLRIDHIEQCLGVLVKHHDALRLNYHTDYHVLFYNPKLIRQKIKIHSFDLRQLNEKEAQESIEKIAFRLKKRTRITNGHLLSAALIYRNNGHQFLIICIHHLCVDGISWQILLEDLDHLFKVCQEGMPLKLEYETTSFQYWVNELQNTQQNKTTEFERMFLQYSPSDVIPSKKNDTLHQLTFSLSKRETEQLLQLADNYSDIQIVHLLMTAYLMTLSHLMSVDTLWVIVEHHGRNSVSPSINLSRTIGWFTVMCPLYFVLSADVGCLIKEVKKNMNLFHQQVPNLALTNPWLKKYPTPYRFNYLGSLDGVYSTLEVEKIGIGPESHRENSRPLVDFNVFMRNNTLSHMLVMPDIDPFTSDLFEKTYRSMIVSILGLGDAPRCKEKKSASEFDTIVLDDNEIEELIKS